MTVSTVHTNGEETAGLGPPSSRATPRFGGMFWSLARVTSPLTLPLAGKRWNPIFAVVEHQGRRTGRHFAAPVAARRIPGGFVISLAFGAQVDWYRNLLAAGGGTIRWRGGAYSVTAPEPIDPALARATFLPVQRALLRLTGIDGFVQVDDRKALAE
jgi:deazaflavin-dependent oxidoreductase (nitroreductase family)